MITVQEATEAIYQFLFRPQFSSIRLEDAVGMVLAEPIKADRDFPPFDRVTMDGIAIHFDAWKHGTRSFEIEGTAAAGKSRASLHDKSKAFEVMTGAMLPYGTDTVIRYEDLTILDKKATVADVEISKGQNVHVQGQDARRDEILVDAGMKLSSAEIALLASVGKSHVMVYAFPSTAIVGSGDELVEINSQPEAHQIRRSNTYAIQAAMRAVGWYGEQFHINDDAAALRTALADLLNKHEVLILSGGVSKGKYDFIPTVLEQLGVKKIFHEVSQRPGKPFWFGVKDEKRVFALPGNPVSTFMCFHRYILPWLYRSFSLPEPFERAVLASNFSFPPKLTCFLQVQIKNENGRLIAIPRQGAGSGDFANLKHVDGFLELPMDQSEFKAGEAFSFIPFRL